MADLFSPETRRAVRLAQARADYAQARVRLAADDLAGCDWLVATHRGLFGVGQGTVVAIMHGWFFGLHVVDGQIFLFENCGHRDTTVDHGRIIRLDLVARRIVGAAVLAEGLHNNCHQLRLIDGVLCLVDTARQRVLRFAPDGAPIDRQQVVPPAPSSDTTGAYCHLNSIAKVAGRLVVMAHHGRALPERPSELLWLDDCWQIATRQVLPGRGCHDVVADTAGVLWHCDSLGGAVFAGDGRRVTLSDRLMTRGLALTATRIMVGLSSFGPRQLRDSLGGAVVLLDQDLRPIVRIALPSGPTDIAAL